MITGLMTAQEFVETRHTFPEGGRWHELHSGRPVLLESPNDEHGTVVLNLSRAMARWFSSQTAEFSGYAAHDVGIHVETAPDTVLMPPVSYFDKGNRFGQSDLLIATLVPKLVVEIASSNDRRQLVRERTLMFLNHGVECVWITDPFKREVQILERGAHTLVLGDHQTLDGGDQLPGFELTVAELFTQPDWWKKM
ncbi:MAG: Uma2 family endonuclease [Fuerstiella sp.]|nr:Uma2 family endonuclease [Fuerstiella sp.]